MDLKLNQKSVLVTGGASGIGREITRLYADETGVNIAFTYFSDKNGADALTHQLQRTGASSLCLFMNLADPESIEQAVKKVADSFGGIDVLINNAVFWGSPGSRGKKFEEISLEEWRKVLNTNVLGTVGLIQSVVPYMRKRQFGRIVNISSDIAYESMPGSGAYGTMKAALSGLTANLVTEFSADNILSNIVVPSLTFTDKAIHRFPETFQKAAENAFPTRRVTRPEDVASLVVYLGSGANTHVNGEEIRVTGKGSQPMLNDIFRNITASG